MNLQQLIYFKKVAELEHYTKASESLHITQPGLSHAISELEKELGVPLFYRQGRNVKLTRFGLDFLKHIGVALDEIDLAVKDIQNKSGIHSGSIFLAHISSMYEHYIPSLMTRFYRDPKNIHIKLEMQEIPTVKMVQDLKERKLDLGFGGYVDDPELEFDRIYTERLAIIAGKDHPLSKKKSVSLAEAAEYDFLSYSSVCAIRASTDEMFEAVGLQRNIVGEYEDNNMIVRLVAMNEGIAVVPEMSAVDRLSVFKIDIEDVQAERELYMISLKDDYKTPLVARFMDFVKTQMVFDEISMM